MEQAIETGKGFAKDKTQHKKLKNFLAQVVAACSKYLMLLDIGMAVSFATIAIPPMLKGEGGLKITEEESSWFGVSDALVCTQGVGRGTSGLPFFTIVGVMSYYYLSGFLRWFISPSSAVDYSHSCIALVVPYLAFSQLSTLTQCLALGITSKSPNWILVQASLVFVWQPVGSLTTVAFSKYGRKTAMIFLQLPLLVGWILPYFATSVWELYVAASIMGIGVGFVQAPIATYIGEVTEPHYRGALASVAYSMFTLGQVVIFGIDVITQNWRISSIVSSIVPILTAVHLCLIPESPMWLISKGRYEEAKSALRWLRGWASEEDVEQEYKDLLYHNCNRYADLCAEEGRQEIKGVSGQVENPPPSVKDFTSKSSFHPSMAMSETDKMSWAQKYFLRPEMYNPMIFTVIFMYLSNGSGLGVFRSYLVLLLQHFKISWDEVKVSVAVTVVGLFGTILMVILIPLIGKRKLTFISVVLTSLGCLALGIYILFEDKLQMTWIPMVILVEILFVSNLGICHIPWIQISEIFPLKGKTFGTGLVAGLGNVLQFIGIKLFYTYESIFTLGGVFIMYAVTYALGLVYLYFYQVETEGRPLNDIVEDFKHRRRSR